MSSRGGWAATRSQANQGVTAVVVDASGQATQGGVIIDRANFVALASDTGKTLWTHIVTTGASGSVRLALAADGNPIAAARITDPPLAEPLVVQKLSRQSGTPIWVRSLAASGGATGLAADVRGAVVVAAGSASGGVRAAMNDAERALGEEPTIAFDMGMSLAPPRRSPALAAFRPPS